MADLLGDQLNVDVQLAHPAPLLQQVYGIHGHGLFLLTHFVLPLVQQSLIKGAAAKYSFTDVLKKKK